MTNMRFRLRLLGDRPIFDIAPLSSRMISAYQDRTGRTHLFTDRLDHDRTTAFDLVIDSFDAEIAYYSSNDLTSFTGHGPVASKGRWTGRIEDSDLDCIGCASPGVVVAGGHVLLFHAGRGPCDPAGPFIRATGLPQLPGRIMLAAAVADDDGAAAGPFEKRGPITDYDAPWATRRPVRRRGRRPHLPLLQGDQLAGASTQACHWPGDRPRR